MLIPVLIAVAFLTLLERKILGYSQSRKGPNKVSLFGLLQPFSDAIKLLAKEFPLPEKTNKRFFWISPVVSLTLVLLSWSTIPLGGPSFDFSLILLILFLGLGLYPIFISAWASNRAYATIGALRGVAQTVSYEVSLAVILITIFSVVRGLTIRSLLPASRTLILLALLPSLIIWLISGLAETNRTPFDFAEGERELVSGFNIEYGSGGFVLIFLAEYAAILLMSFITGLILNLTSNFPGSTILATLLICYFWVWARATLPRYRYDKLIGLAWKSILPASLVLLRTIVWVL